MTLRSRNQTILVLAAAIVAVGGPAAGREATARGQDAHSEDAADHDARAAELQQRLFRLCYEVEVTDLPRGARLNLWVPRPQSGPHQTVSDFRVVSDVPVHLTREPAHGNAMVFLTSAGLDRVALRMEATVLRREARALEGQGAERAAEQTLRDWLAPDRLVPTDGVIAELAALHAPEDATPLDAARALYDYVTDTLEYDKTGTGWGRGDALFACDARRGNCTDFHSLFIGMARAREIPARFEIGFSLPSDADSGEIAGYHCWAQFHVPDVGWVPIDSSEASRHPDRREYFFGSLDANRVLLTVGRDLVLEPPQEGEPLNFFVCPYAELDGEPLPSDQIACRVHFEDVRGE